MIKNIYVKDYAYKNSDKMAMLTFDGIVSLLATTLFGGSTTLAGLAMLIAAWLVCAVILMNFKGANPAYSIVILIPIAIFFSAYGILNETIMIVIVLVSSVVVAAEFKKVAD